MSSSLGLVALVSCSGRGDSSAELRPGLPPNFVPLERLELREPRVAVLEAVAPWQEAYFVAGLERTGGEYFSVLVRDAETASLSRISLKESSEEEWTTSSIFRHSESGAAASRLELRLDRDRRRVRYSWAPVSTGPFLLGQVAPDLAFTDLEGGPASLGDLRGHVVVINWWAVWCAPCVEEFPVLNALAADFGEGSGVRFLALAPDPPEKIRHLLAQRPFSFRQAWVEREAADMLGPSFPRHLVLDPRGVVTFDRGGGGAGEPEGLRSEIERLVGSEHRSSPTS